MEDGSMKNLEALNPRDSKLLTAHEREAIYPRILKVLKHCSVIVIEPDEIDKAVQGHEGLNLNRLEARKSAQILNELKPDRAIIDCPSNNIMSYKSYLQGMLENKKIELVLEHNAERYALVAAASIVAKVTGDRLIEELKNDKGADFGSGYLSDPKTSDFLKNNFEIYPNIFRKSWFPYKDMVNNKFQKSLSDFTRFLKEDEEKKSPTLDDLKKLEEFGFHFEQPKSASELAIMKGPCTVILYRNGKLLVQGKEDVKKSVMKIFGK